MWCNYWVVGYSGAPDRTQGKGNECISGGWNGEASTRTVLAGETTGYGIKVGRRVQRDRATDRRWMVIDEGKG